MSQEPWQVYFDGLPIEEQRRIALAAVNRLIEIEEVRFSEGYNYGPDDQGDPLLYWESYGEDLREESE